MYAEKISEAVGAIRAVLAVVPVTVYDYVPPPGQVASPVVIIDRNGRRHDAAETIVPVRVYVAASKHGGARAAQLVLDETLDAIEDALAADSAQSEGDTAYIDAADVWVADLRVTVSRI